MSDRVLVVIPARYGSTRFEGKALADLCGRPMIVRTVERALGMQEADAVLVATDDERIAAAVTAAGHRCEMTGEDHQTGTDRIGEVLERSDADIVVNLQGDEPLLDPAMADRLVRALKDDPACALATCARRFGPEDDWADPGLVKVLVDRAGRALYFSRAPIPGVFPGAPPQAAPREAALCHVGIYAWRAAALRRFVAWPRGGLEQVEGLEQLRALEHGLPVRVLVVEEGPIGVDTPADLERARALWRLEHGAPPEGAGT